MNEGKEGTEKEKDGAERCIIRVEREKEGEGGRTRVCVSVFNMHFTPIHS